MRVSYILAAVVVVLVIFGFRVLIGRFFTLEGRTLGAVSVMDKASKGYDDAAAVLSALLDVKLQPGEAGLLGKHERHWRGPVTRSVTKTQRDGAAPAVTDATSTACRARRMVTGETDQAV
jgi:hypothetical protein